MKTNFKSFIFILLSLNFIFTPYLFALEEMMPIPKSEAFISMDLQDASLKDVLKILSMQSNLNFVASEAVSDRTLTLYMDKVPLKEAMNKIFTANNLSYDLDSEASVFIVKDWGKPEIETVTEVFYLKHATVSSSSLREEMKNNISSEGDSTSSSSSSSSSGSSSEDKGKWKVEDDSGITQSVKKLLSKDGKVIEDFRTNSLIVTDIPSRMPVIRKVITFLDVAVPQVMLEVEILDVSKDVVDQIGFKFGQTPLSVAITGGQATLGFPYHSWAKAFAGGYGTIDINNASTAGGAYKAQLDFLRTQTDTKFLARPRLLSLNNETAEIKIITDEAIGVSSVQEGQGTSSSTTVTAERFETGVSLRVTPQIDLASGEITMFIYPKVSEASTTKSSFTAGTEATKTYEFINPEVRSTKTTVRVKDGETMVLGGLIRKQYSTVITKLPVLGDIPFFGALFRHKSQTPGRDRELLVFITPRIVKDSGYAGRTEGVLSQVKKMALPAREQSTVTVISRQSSINTYLNTLEKQR